MTAENAIDNIVNDKQDVKNSLINIPDVVSSYSRFNKVVSPQFVVKKIEQRSIQSSFIIGHPTLAQRDVTPLDASFGAYQTIYVVPKDQIYSEYFGQDLFIDSSSTGTLDASNETFTLASGEYYQSDIIFKTDRNIVSVDFLNVVEGISFIPKFRLNLSKLNVDPLGGGNVEVEVSNDAGTTWEVVSNVYTSHTFTTPASQGLKVRFTAQDGFVIDDTLTIKVNTD